jgi:putative transposase
LHVASAEELPVMKIVLECWLVTFMHYDFGYFDDETCRLEPIDNPFEVRNCYPSLRPE